MKGVTDQLASAFDPLINQFSDGPSVARQGVVENDNSFGYGITHNSNIIASGSDCRR